MSVLRVLPIKDPTERVLLAFDFGPEIPADDVLNAAAVVVEAVVAGVDSAPQVLDGAPMASGQQALQWVHEGLPAATYRLRCTASTAQGRVLVLRTLLPVAVVT